MEKRKLSKKIIFVIVASLIISSILLTCLGLQIFFMIADTIACYTPDYEKKELSEVLSKDTLSDEDYEFLYRQTGLAKLGIDRLCAMGDDGIKRISEIQDSLFTRHAVRNEWFSPFVCTDFIYEKIPTAILQDGDIIVSSSTHFSGWRIGHSGLVTDSSKGLILQASAVGDSSSYGGINDFNERTNFIILSPKADDETKAKVCEYASKNLLGLDYDPAAGVFTPKNSTEKTQCAHLIWYAYKQFGIDLDCNGGLVVTPKDLANSPLMEIVQVFGFNLDDLWK